MIDQTYNVCDDSGFLALLDPDTYSSFVDEYWELNQLFDHFRQQMKEQRLLIWGTGMENIWKVQVRLEPAPIIGFQDIQGTIKVSEGNLLLTSYDTLSGAAQLADVALPGPSEFDQMFTLEAGSYDCRIVQLHNHEYSEENDEDIDKAISHYVLELRKSKIVRESWQHVLWADPAL